MENMRIRVLDDDLINKIAAGEVVERPASVVKELVENSIDAGAGQIVVELAGAGKKRISVADNGRGMSEEEISLAFQRHSTSKISSLEDLFNIRTLGFRGEALPSIASVSRTRIERNPAGQGLAVEVKELFFNTPARKKFLKADATELGHCGEVVTKYSLAYPGIAFKMISDGKTLLNTSGSGKLIDALVAVYGAELARELVEVNAAFPGGKISGYVSRPNISRLDKNYESFYVNRRFIRNFLLNRALEEAYRTLIPHNRYPVAVLFIDVDPREIDVNVHPTKREVKFVKTQEVMNAVTNAVREALSKVTDTASWGRAERVEGEWAINSREAGGFGQLPMTGPIAAGSEQINTFIPPESEFQVSAVQPLLPLYQLKQTYIVATDGDELVLIDQHAAHERILYDRLCAVAGLDQNSQALLIPETLNLDAADANVLQENAAYLNSLGFGIDEFGGNSFILRGVPAISEKVAPKPLLLDLLSELREIEKGTQLEVKKENIRKLVACHSAIKAGDKLERSEMDQLIRDLFATQNPLTCPHGRPTMVRIIEEELKKRFGR